jgi:hypothetical protein
MEHRTHWAGCWGKLRGNVLQQNSAPCSSVAVDSVGVIIAIFLSGSNCILFKWVWLVFDLDEFSASSICIYVV